MQQYITYKRKKRQGPAPSLTPGKPYPVIEERETPDGQKVLINNDRGVNKWYYRDAFEEEKPEGPWDVKYMGSVSSTEAGTEYDDWIEITDGKVTLYLDGGLEDNDEQLLVNFLNARKIKLDYDHESELAAHLLEQELKRANRVVQAQEEYIELLVKEIESMVAIAYVHGWRSDNHEKGARVREKIAALKEGRKEVENG